MEDAFWRSELALPLNLLGSPKPAEIVIKHSGAQSVHQVCDDLQCKTSALSMTTRNLQCAGDGPSQSLFDLFKLRSVEFGRPFFL